ncbi:MAG: outer membrane lipoprotein-sorting protein [Opitutaceae bacterium]|nr:outer membrane lipoprotein-sorting protein [Opitutaceae bacterium]
MARVAMTFRQVTLGTCLFAAFVLPQAAHAQHKRPRPAPQFAQFTPPDQKKGQELLADFRQRGLGDGYFEFELRYLPRRGEERVTPGKMWLGRNEKGPISRTTLWPGDATRERRLLVQNGPKSAVWAWTPSDGIAVAPLDSAALFKRLAETELTAFDLQMPYLFWQDFVYEGTVKLRGRVAESFLLYPPQEIAAQKPELLGVRVYVDTQFHALVQSEWVGEGNRVLKTLQVVDFKKVGEQWVVKTIDLRNEETRDKTRFAVTAAATGMNWDAAVFDEGGLAATLPPISKDQLQKIDR